MIKITFGFFFFKFCFCPGATKGIVASVTSQLSKEREVTASSIFFSSLPHAITNH
jgi:hypothetical protein